MQKVDLATLCARYGYNNQTEVAKAVGITQQAVNYLFNNSDKIGLQKLRELCDGIGCKDMREAFTDAEGVPYTGAPGELSNNRTSAEPDEVSAKQLLTIKDDEVLCPHCGQKIKLARRWIATIE